jgi:DNA-binding transcriptional MerR regulator
MTGAPTSDPTPQQPSRDSLRIGDVARLLDTTPRTIRYYEEIGLLAPAPARHSGKHRLYSHEEVERIREVMRLKHLLGVTLEELKTLLTAEDARAEVRAQLRRDDVGSERRRELLAEALGHIDRQLELVRHRAGELAKLENELCDSHKRVRRKIRELDARTTGSFPPPPPRATTAAQPHASAEPQPTAEPQP